jgi:hypothetical protein
VTVACKDLVLARLLRPANGSFVHDFARPAESGISGGRRIFLRMARGVIRRPNLTRRHSVYLFDIVTSTPEHIPDRTTQEASMTTSSRKFFAVIIERNGQELARDILHIDGAADVRSKIMQL